MAVYGTRWYLERGIEHDVSVLKTTGAAAQLERGLKF